MGCECYFGVFGKTDLQYERSLIPAIGTFVTKLKPSSVTIQRSQGWFSVTNTLFKLTGRFGGPFFSGVKFCADKRQSNLFKLIYIINIPKKNWKKPNEVCCSAILNKIVSRVSSACPIFRYSRHG